jgi:hypothetical protein
MDETTPLPAVSDTSAAEPENLAIAVSHEDFVAGLPVGRFRLIVNPQRAYRFVAHRLFLNGVSVPLLGLGIALGLVGYIWPAAIICVIGFGLRRLVKAQAANILLHLVQKDAKTYYDTIEFEIMEVRLAQD